MAPLGAARALITAGGAAGALTLIKANTFSGDSSVTVNNIQEDVYDVHFFTCPINWFSSRHNYIF